MMQPFFQWTYSFQQTIFLLLVLPYLYSCSTPSERASGDYYTVTKVIDGDTFWVDDGSEKGRKVRLIGVDAPETRRTARKAVGYYAKESREFMKALLLNREVRLEFDAAPRDRYGRTLAYVYLHDGTFVNAELLKLGYAMVMTVPPNVRHAEDFLHLQVEARRRGMGLWKE